MSNTNILDISPIFLITKKPQKSNDIWRRTGPVESSFVESFGKEEK